MSRAAEITMAFGGEERLFRLPIGRLRALQEKTDSGPMELIQRLVAGNWRIDDVREPILQGLIGGGMDSRSATQLLLDHFDDLPVLPFVAVAQAIVAASVIGVEEETMEKHKAGTAKNTRSRAARSGSLPSTAPAQ